jgi:transcriptional regulator with XRE-family HTH domain
MNTRIKQLRKALGLSQNEFSKRIGRTPGFVSRAETDHVHITDSVITDICAAFGVREEWLRDGDGEMFRTSHHLTDNETIGDRIRQVRKMEGLKQEEFGKKVGVSKNQIYSIETGRSKASDGLVRKIAGYCNVSYEWLIRGVGEMKLEYAVDQTLIDWLQQNPDVIVELRNRMR